MGRRGRKPKGPGGKATTQEGLERLGTDLLFFTEKNLEIESSCEVIARANQETKGLVTIYSGLDGKRPSTKGYQPPRQVNVLAGEKPWLAKNAGSHLWRDPGTRSVPGAANGTKIIETPIQDPITHGWGISAPWLDPTNLQWKMSATPVTTYQAHQEAGRPSVIRHTNPPPTWPGQQIYDANGTSLPTTESGGHDGWFKIGDPWSMAGTPGNMWHSPVQETPTRPPNTPPRA